MSIASPIKARLRTSILFKKVMIPHWLQAVMVTTMMFYLTCFAIKRPAFLVACVIIAWAVFLWATRTGQSPEHAENAESETPQRGRKAAFVAGWNSIRSYTLWWLIMVLIGLAGSTCLAVLAL